MRFLGKYTIYYMIYIALSSNVLEFQKNYNLNLSLKIYHATRFEGQVCANVQLTRKSSPGSGVYMQEKTMSAEQVRWIDAGCLRQPAHLQLHCTRERSLTREREKEGEDHLHIYIRKKFLFGLFARSNSSATYCKRSIFEIFIVSTIIKYSINLQENPDFHNTSLEFKQILLLSHR